MKRYMYVKDEMIASGEARFFRFLTKQAKWDLCNIDRVRGEYVGPFRTLHMYTIELYFKENIDEYINRFLARKASDSITHKAFTYVSVKGYIRKWTDDGLFCNDEGGEDIGNFHLQYDNDYYSKYWNITPDHVINKINNILYLKDGNHLRNWNITNDEYPNYNALYVPEINNDIEKAFFEFLARHYHCCAGISVPVGRGCKKSYRIFSFDVKNPIEMIPEFIESMDIVDKDAIYEMEHRLTNIIDKWQIDGLMKLSTNGDDVNFHYPIPAYTFELNNNFYDDHTRKFYYTVPKSIREPNIKTKTGDK